MGAGPEATLHRLVPLAFSLKQLTNATMFGAGQSAGVPLVPENDSTLRQLPAAECVIRQS